MARVNMQNVPDDYNVPTGTYLVVVKSFEEKMTKEEGRIMDVLTFEIAAHPDQADYVGRQQTEWYVIGSKANPAMVDERGMGMINLKNAYKAANIAHTGDTEEMGRNMVGAQIALRLVKSERRDQPETFETRVKGYFKPSEVSSKYGPDEVQGSAPSVPGPVPPPQPPLQPAPEPAQNPAAPPPTMPGMPVQSFDPAQQPAQQQQPQTYTTPDGQTFTDVVAWQAHMNSLNPT